MPFNRKVMGVDELARNLWLTNFAALTMKFSCDRVRIQLFLILLQAGEVSIFLRRNDGLNFETKVTTINEAD